MIWYYIYFVLLIPVIIISSGHVLEIVDDIEKSPSDYDRSYRGLTLENGLKILLISDPSTNLSAAALSVNVGFRNSWKKIQGMPHFVEHMVFQGSQKYPGKSQFWNFVGENGGGTNAETWEDKTVFKFYISSDQFVAALDVWAHFFIDPVFNESAAYEEVNTIHSEAVKNSRDDFWRTIQVFKSLSDSNDGYGEFCLGNIETLVEGAQHAGLKLDEEVMKYFHTYYSSNLMSLAMYDKRSLDELTEIVAPIFSQITNKNNEGKLVKGNAWKNPYGNNFLGKKIRVAAVKDYKYLIMTFPIPIDFQSINVRNKAVTEYIERFLNEKRRGSFQQKLMQENLITKMQVHANGFAPSGRGSRLFQIVFTLTDSGVDKVDVIVENFFAYLAAVKARTNKEWINDEIKLLAHNRFILRNKKPPLTYVYGLVDKLADDVEYRNILIDQNEAVEPFDEEFLRKVLSYFTATNLNYAVLSKSFRGQLDRVERHFNVKFSVEALTAEFIKRLDNAKEQSLGEDLVLPTQNEFIPRKLNFYQNLNYTPSQRHPRIMINTKNYRLWYARDEVFRQSFCTVNFLIRTSTNTRSLTEQVQKLIIVSSLGYLVDQKLHYAQLAGYTFSLTDSVSGLNVNLAGYVENMNLLIGNIFEILMTSSIDNFLYLNTLSRLTDQVRSSMADKPYKRLIKYFERLTSFLKNVDEEDFLAELRGVTHESVLKLRESLFQKTYIEVLICGDLEQGKATDLFSTAISILRNYSQSSSLKDFEIHRDRQIRFPAKLNLFEKMLPVQAQTGTLVAFQIETNVHRRAVLMDLLGRIICDLFFSAIRTEEKLGYVVDCATKSNLVVSHIVFVVAGPYQPVFVDSRIERFVNKIPLLIDDISEAKFNGTKKALQDSYVQKPNSLEVQSRSFLFEIEREEYFFGRRAEAADKLNGISKEDLLDFTTEFLLDNSPARRKLAIRLNVKSNMLTKSVINGENGTATKQLRKTDFLEDKNSDTFYNITNIAEFKRYSSIYQLPKPKLLLPVNWTL